MTDGPIRRVGSPDADPSDDRTAALRRGTRTASSAVRSGLVRSVDGVRRALARPTASDVATTLTALVVTALAGSLLVGARLAALAMGAGIAAAIAAVLLASRNPAIRAAGGVVAVPVAVLAATPATLAWAFALGIGGFGVVAAVALWSMVFGGIAAVLVSWDALGEGGMRRAATGTLLVAVGVVGVVALRLLPEAGVRERAGTAAGDLATAGTDLLVHPDPDLALVTFFGLVAVAAFLLRRTIGYPPFERLLPPDRRDAFSDAIADTRRALSYVSRGGFVCGLAALVVPAIAKDLEATPATLRSEIPAPVGAWLASLVTAPGVRLGLLALAGAALAIALAEWSRRALRRGLAGVLARFFAPVVGGAVVALALARTVSDPALNGAVLEIAAEVAPASVVELLGSFPAFAIAAVVLVLALSSLSSTLFSVTWLRIVRLLPPRAVGAALAAVAAFALALVLALVGRVEPAVWTGAAAFVVWDVGAYAEDVRRDLGRDARTLRAELVHAGGSALTGLVVAGGAVALYRRVALDGPAVDPRLGAVAVAAGVLTTVLVAWTLRV